MPSGISKGIFRNFFVFPVLYSKAFLIKEVYGSWFDPSNPVISPGGSMRPDLRKELLELSDSMDLCVVIGSSLM